MPNTRLNVSVLGRRYELSGAEDASHYIRVGDLVNRCLQEAALLDNENDTDGAAVFAALRLADEYIRAQTEADRLRTILEQMREAASEKSNPAQSTDAPSGEPPENMEGAPEELRENNRTESAFKQTLEKGASLRQTGGRQVRKIGGKNLTDSFVGSP